MVFAELRESEVVRQEGLVQRVVGFVWDFKGWIFWVVGSDATF